MWKVIVSILVKAKWILTYLLKDNNILVIRNLLVIKACAYLTTDVVWEQILADFYIPNACIYINQQFRYCVLYEFRWHGILLNDDSSHFDNGGAFNILERWYTNFKFISITNIL